ncbi:glycosyl transferase group 1 [Thermodesulfatator indicus DSM 15286]|uniref:Glycosyl transferase group 1 n=2 Tax=Thermodesulfatator indicus TaxID=171695 RepID=F8ADY7_THEID|nr:glycosyl transferase group 1 [Thermodesulfatator indicus DSM 15286]
MYSAIELQKRLGIFHSKVSSLFKALLLLASCYKDLKTNAILPKKPLRPRPKGSPLKIAIVTEYYYPILGGITEHVHHFAKELLAKGHEVTIITPEAGPFGRDVGEIANHIIKLGRSVSIYSNDSFARISLGQDLGSQLEKILFEGQFDLVHVHSPLTPTLPLLAIYHSPVPVVGTFHTHFEENLWLSMFKERLRPFMEAMALRIAVSPICIASMEKFLPGFSYVVVPNGIDTNWYSPEQKPISRFTDDHFNILYVGRFDPRNGLDILIEAFKILAREKPNIRLIIMGFGPLEPTYRKMVPKELTEKIIFVGKIDEERPAYYRSAHVLCFPAKKGSFGITLLEAMASGVPVVTTDIEGFRFVMEDGKHGLMVKPEHGAEGYARALKFLLENPEKRKEMAQKARERALEFSWDKVTADLLDHYYEILPS